MFRKKTVVIATGGTKGHVKPAQCIAEALGGKYRVIVLIDKRGMVFWEKSIENKNIIIINIGIFRYLGKIGRYLFDLPLACIKSIYILFKYRVNLCIGFGSYSSFAPVLASVILNVPMIIHEQNAIIGQVNDFFKKMAKKVFLTFPKTLCRNTDNRFLIDKRYLHIWNPIFREEDIDRPINSRTSLANREKVILITGGSQGSFHATSLILKAFKLFTEEQKSNIKVYHQVPASKIQFALEEYRKLDIKNVVVKPYFEDLLKLMDEADLFIGRGGSCTVFEVIQSCTPSILIPASNAKDNHQYYNVSYFASQDACKILDQSAEEPRILYNNIIEVIYDPIKRRKLIDNMKTFENIKNALPRIIDIIKKEFLTDK